jgi:hypothetical protein
MGDKMIHQILQIMRKTITEDCTVYSYTASRVYPEHLAAVKDPIFPCITLYFKGGLSSGCIKESAKDTVFIKVCSDKNYKECYAIYDAIYMNILHNKRLSDDNYHILCREIMRPRPYIDKKGDPVIYYIEAHYEVFSQRR